MQLHSVDEAKLKAITEAMEALHAALEDLHGCEVELVTAVRHHITDNDYKTMIVSRLEAERAAPILWHALGDVQMIVKSMQPPTLTKQ